MQLYSSIFIHFMFYHSLIEKTKDNDVSGKHEIFSTSIVIGLSVDDIFIILRSFSF